MREAKEEAFNHVSRRSKILVRVDGSTKLGMGHIARCVRLIKYLVRIVQPSPEVSFAVALDTKARLAGAAPINRPSASRVRSTSAG